MGNPDHSIIKYNLENDVYPAVSEIGSVNSALLATEGRRDVAKIVKIYALQ
jgi:hypothetical protein